MCSQGLSRLLALSSDLCFKSRHLATSLHLGSFLPTSLGLLTLPVPRAEPGQLSPTQEPYFCREPELTGSTPQSSSHHCPSQATARDRGWMASLPEMSSGIPSAAQGQPPGAQCCPCPSLPSSHLLHPCAPLHAQGQQGQALSPAAERQSSRTLSLRWSQLWW